MPKQLSGEIICCTTYLNVCGDVEVVVCPGG